MRTGKDAMPMGRFAALGLWVSGLSLASSRRPVLFCGMAEPRNQALNMLNAVASAAATAYALAYVVHFEWGLSRIRIREDALALAALLGAALTVRIVLQRGKKTGS